MKSSFRVLLTAAALALVLASCAKAPPTPAPATPAPAATPTPTPTPAPATPAPAAIPTPTPPRSPTGELKVALSSLGDEALDPTLSSPLGKMYFSLYLDYLVGSTPELTLSKELGIARDWEVEHGQDSSRYTFKLRPGVKFHNGDQVTSTDVKFSLEYVMRPRSVASYVAVLRDSIKSIETPDPLTVVITTKAPYAFLLWDLSAVIGALGVVLPSKYIQEKGEDYFALYPVGSGPYKVTEQRVGSYIVLEAVPNHWRVGAPRYQTIRLMLAREAGTRMAMLKVGEADIVDVPREQLKELAAFNTFLKEGSVRVGVVFHQTWEGYLSNPKVREALNLAIDREAIRDAIFAGQAELTGSWYYGSWNIGYKPLALYPYDPDRAKRLLAEAYPGGIELTVYTYAWVGTPEAPGTMEAVASMWGKIGVRYKIIPTDWPTYRTKWGKKELINSVSVVASANRPQSHGLFSISYASRGALTMLRDPEVDRLIAEIAKALDLDKYAELVWQVAKRARENHYNAPLLEAGEAYAANPKKVAQWNMGRAIYDMNLEDLFWVR